MKRILISVMVLPLMVGGCAGFKPFFTSAQGIACNPPANVIAVAKVAAPLIEIALAMIVPGTAAYLAAVDASAVVNAIQKGICVSVKQLNSLIAFLSSDAAKSARIKQVKMAAGLKAMPAPINLQPLVDWAGIIK